MNSLLPLVVALLFCGLGPIQGQSLSLDVDEPIERFDLPLAASQEILRYQIGPLAVGHTYDIDLPIGKSHELVVRNRAADQLSTFRWRGTVYMPYLEIELHPQQITADNDLRLTVADFTDIHQRQVAARRMGSIEVTATDDAITLVDAVFKNQSCFATSEQTFLGEFLLQPQPDGSIDTVSQLGTFANGSSSVSFEQGIILSTGRVSNAEGPNDNNFSTQDYGTSSLDADMQVLSGGNPVNDMAVLEFEFRPTSDEINFDYVFASEEYCEAFNDNNTDVFAFFISGPGINGPFTDDAENIAVLPDGTTTINVNTVNHVTNTQFFRNNIDPGFFLNCGLTNPVALDDIGYDGMTTVLTASSPVIPCETYKLRMVIADVGDGFFDSAVMLVNGSFAAGLVNPEPLGASLDSNTFVLDQTEGCTPFEIAFNRVDSTLLADSVVVSYSVSTASSAMNPDDFSINQDSIIIMPGQLADTLIFTTVLDNLPEGTEEIILQLQGTCNCDANQVILRINDSPELDLALSAPPPDCAGSSFELAPTVSGGVGVYTYLWEDSSVDSARMVTTVEGDNIYSVTVTDACGQQDSMSINLATPAITAEL
ncbi:MAG: choice-of-anchor L domain-containing protein, partial [Bacteroidota bacterium]